MTEGKPQQNSMEVDPAEQRFREFADAMPHILWTARPDGYVDYLNKVYTDYTGVSLDVESQSWRLAIHPEDVEPTMAAWNASIRTGAVYSTEFRIIHVASNIYRWQAVTARPVSDASGKITKWYGICTDIHESKIVTEKASLLSRQLYATLESISDAFILLDQNWRITYVNRAAEKTMQRSRDELVGGLIWEEFKEVADGKFYHECQLAAQQREPVEFEHFSTPLKKSFEIRLFPGEAGMSVYFRDITARRKAEEDIHRLAFYDQLTGLPNRQLLQDRLRHVVLVSQRTERWGAVMFIDLDNFKTLNETQGHVKGDLLLRQAAQRLSACLCASDTVARLGGDEFLVVLEDLGNDPVESARQAEQVGEKILATLSRPYDLDGIACVSTASIGVILFQGESQNMEELLKRSDLAMYQAKAAGRNVLRFYDPGMQETINNRLALEAGVRESLQNNLFVLHYQPQMNEAGHVTGAEALLRWTHPLHKHVPPSVFIPLAEETGLINELGHWVLKAACTQLAQWQASADTAGLEISVNVSAHQFHRPDFIARVMEVVRDTGINPRQLKLELTETALIENMEDAVEKMNALKVHGIGVSLDDFGVGYSSLSYLRDLPLEQLKIDRSFINRVPDNNNDVAILQAIILLGRALGLTIIAEGVESEQQRQFLTSSGCSAFQGYLFCKPVAAEDFITFLRKCGTPPLGS